MGLLTPDQVRELRDHLEKHGLTYELLQTEMLDHICCDVEINMEKGLEFEESIKKVTSEIPKNQFKKIQTETMEVLNKKTKMVTIFTYLSFGLLVLATIAKLLRIPPTGGLLISSFVALGATLLVGLFTNPLIKEKERGRGVLIVIVISMIVYLTSLCFQLLHLPAAAFLRFISVISSIAILSGYAIYHYLYSEIASKHMLMQYIKNEDKKIEKSLMVLFAFGITLKFWHNPFVSIVYFMMLFAFGSVFYMVKCWPYFSIRDNNNSFRLFVLVTSIVSYFLLMIPTLLSIIETPARIYMIWGSVILTSITVAIYYTFYTEEKQKYIIGFVSFLVAVISALNLSGKTFLLESELGEYFISIAYSPVVYVGMSLMLVFSFKRPVARALFIMALAFYVNTYQMAGI